MKLSSAHDQAEECRSILLSLSLLKKSWFEVPSGAMDSGSSRLLQLANSSSSSSSSSGPTPSLSIATNPSATNSTTHSAFHRNTTATATAADKYTLPIVLKKNTNPRILIGHSNCLHAMNELETKLLKQVSTAAASFSSSTSSSSTATATNNTVVPSCVVLYHEGVSAHRVLEGHTEQNGRVVKCFQGNSPVMLLRRVLTVC
jgi:hypothetical protein